jgi:hypothetical protein
MSYSSHRISTKDHLHPFNLYKMGVFMIVQFFVFSVVIIIAVLGVLAFEMAEKRAFKKTKAIENCAPTSVEQS